MITERSPPNIKSPRGSDPNKRIATFSLLGFFCPARADLF